MLTQLLILYQFENFPMQWLIGSVKGGNVPERDDLHASGLNLMRNSGGDYWEICATRTD